MALVFALATSVLVLSWPPAWAAPTSRPAGFVVDHRSVDSHDTAIPVASLDRARRLRVYFGHQSVGDNILGGLERLAMAKPARYRLQMGRQASLSWFDTHVGLVDFAVGENGEPRRKIRDFAARMARAGSRVDVAMMKLCYVDLEDGSEPAGVFAAYRATMDRLQQAHPRVRLVWWTSPLTTASNAQRNKFNRLVRQYCTSHGNVLFDLADLESHDARGTAATDRQGPRLCPAWSEDGGHLNELGAARVARAWWHLTARLAGWTP